MTRRAVTGARSSSRPSPRGARWQGDWSLVVSARAPLRYCLQPPHTTCPPPATRPTGDRPRPGGAQVTTLLCMTGLLHSPAGLHCQLGQRKPLVENTPPHPGGEGFSTNRSGPAPLPGALAAGGATVFPKSLYRCNYGSQDHPRFRLDPKSSDQCPSKEKRAHEDRGRDSRSARAKPSYMENGRQLLEARGEARNAFSFRASRRNQPAISV